MKNQDMPAEPVQDRLEAEIKRQTVIVDCAKHSADSGNRVAEAKLPEETKRLQLIKDLLTLITDQQQ